MKLAEVLSCNSIVSDITSQDKNGALVELVKCIADQNREINENELLKVLLEREKLGSTGIGDGIAIPHGKLKTIKRLMASFGRSKEGVNFDSMDGKPAHLFFLLIAPENSVGMHLKILARISKLLKDDSLRKRLMEVTTEEEIYTIVSEKDEQY
ncbi:MAG: PTS sugar transporter subunit IIA [Thermodesulfobacteriota bacterium]|nr:PTS sugar transporter subunit IIA [Thermodesulfobacteriota bacterium]